MSKTNKNIYKELIGAEKYFVYNGTWGDDHEWRIEKVKITGVRIDREKKEYAEFSFTSTGYDYPVARLVSYLKETLEEAKYLAIKQIKEKEDLAIKQIKEKKKKQIKQINNYV